jgi:hypothetical protein
MARLLEAGAECLGMDPERLNREIAGGKFDFSASAGPARARVRVAELGLRVMLLESLAGAAPHMPGNHAASVLRALGESVDEEGERSGSQLAGARLAGLVGKQGGEVT